MSQESCQTFPTPTEPGYYWANSIEHPKDKDFVVEVSEAGYVPAGEPLFYASDTRDNEYRMTDLVWLSPKIEPPKATGAQPMTIDDFDPAELKALIDLIREQGRDDAADVLCRMVDHWYVLSVRALSTDKKIRVDPRLVSGSRIRKA